MISTLFILIASVMCASAQAQTVYYVDPDWTGATNGTAAEPWTQVRGNAQWNVIDAALGTGDVIIYFSAREATVDRDQATDINIQFRRASTSNYRVTLDGQSQYNTNDQAPAWQPYTGTSRFTIITDKNPFTTHNSSTPWEPRYNYTVRGFQFHKTTSGQVMYTSNSHNAIIEQNEISGGGVALIVAEASRKRTPPQFSSNMTIRENYLHSFNSEGIYVNGWKEGEGAPNEWLGSNGMAGDGFLIANNLIAVRGSPTGESDGIDLKDGLQNVIIRGNQITADPGLGVVAIVTNSTATIEQNFIYNWGGQGISMGHFYRITPNRRDAIVRNNVVVNVAKKGILVKGNTDASADQWTNCTIANNVVHNVHSSPGLAIELQNALSDVNLYNNIVSHASNLALSAGALVTLTHQGNLWHRQSGGTVVQYGSQSYTAATITDFDPHALSKDPQFVSPLSPPRVFATDYRVQETSAVLCKGVPLATVQDDFLDIVRTAQPDFGAFQMTGSGCIYLQGVAPPHRRPATLTVGTEG